MALRAVLAERPHDAFSNAIRPDLVFADAHAVGLGAKLEMATLAASIKTGAGLPAGAWLSLNVSPGPPVARVAGQ